MSNPNQSEAGLAEVTVQEQIEHALLRLMAELTCGSQQSMSQQRVSEIQSHLALIQTIPAELARDLIEVLISHSTHASGMDGICLAVARKGGVEMTLEQKVKLASRAPGTHPKLAVARNLKAVEPVFRQLIADCVKQGDCGTFFDLTEPTRPDTEAVCLEVTAGQKTEMLLRFAQKEPRGHIDAILAVAQRLRLTPLSPRTKEELVKIMIEKGDQVGYTALVPEAERQPADVATILAKADARAEQFSDPPDFDPSDG